ncbi:SDR family NAD(P)-dependent oxidoreductase [Granulicella sp. dw_53]|uniref:SDR family NAD(P)-dependent oxidoreductase n=1 Tax=Granulicella sp. dw_53 TaxID=2719792 RepID=UPI001BD395A6|nr:SDR family NAD(P)-dependent oxidoreductase [Granulicella sp. dw_53]
MAATPFATYPSLRDRTILITGGATGIGASLVEAFAHQGAQVAFLDIQDEAAQALIARLQPLVPHTPIYLYCDLTDIPSLQLCLSNLPAKLPGIDVLINNAANDSRHATADVTPELWDRLMAVNLKHQFFVTQAVIPGMKQRQRGSILNMSSIAWAIPTLGLPVYVTAKAAIVGLTRSFAHELGPHNIRVNCILPGAILTDRQKQLWFTEAYSAEILSRQALKRHLQPEEVARLALFLAADDSSAITNQSYIIDGGWI